MISLHQLLFFFSIVRVNSLWNLEVSPDNIASVPFGERSVSVWEHSSKKGTYYVGPLAYLQKETIKARENLFTGKSELSFDILMWSEEMKEAVYRHLKRHVNSEIIQENIEMLPIDQLRVVWQSEARKLSSDLQIDDSWKSYTGRDSIITSHLTCTTFEMCEKLVSYMKNHSDACDPLHIQYKISEQNSFKRDLHISLENLRSGNLYTKLINMKNTVDGTRYLTSDDMKIMVLETKNNIEATLITEHGYLETGEEVKLADTIERLLDTTEVDVEGFDEQLWNSVFWDPTWARPDLMSSYLNKVITKNTESSLNFEVKEFDAGSSSSVEIPSFLGIFPGLEFISSDTTKQKVSRQSFLNLLKERYSNVEWTGEKFNVQPMKLHRINLSRLDSSTDFQIKNIQVDDIETIHSVKIRVNDRLPPQNPTLTHTLVMQRLEDEIELINSELKSMFDNYSSDMNDDLLMFMNDTDIKITALEDGLIDIERRTDIKMTALEDGLHADVAKIPTWPGSKFCILQNGDCPSGFSAHNAFVESIEKDSEDSGKGWLYFGSSYIYEAYSFLGLSIQTCCK